MKLFLGDCLEELKQLDDNSVDSIVTDPPYGLSFMGKHWDYDVPSIEIWKECLRVLKPGGYLLSFAGSRTYHRMAVRIEDAGFEIRDQIMWIYGSGFPKSMNIGKAIDKIGGESLSWFIDYILKIADERGISRKDLTMLFPSKNGNPTGWLWNKQKTQGITLEQFNKIKDFLQLPFENIEEVEREIIGRGSAGLTKGTIANFAGQTEFDITKGNSEWEGWGTALKPAHEPIVMARKPLSEKTVVDNVLKHNTGGINIDESRVGNDGGTERTNGSNAGKPRNTLHGGNFGVTDINKGRFPANVIMDEEAGKLLDEQSGISKSTGGSGEKSKGALGNNVYGKYKNEELADNAGGLGDVGGASRFFYCAKASKTDRDEGMDKFEEVECGMMDDDAYEWKDDVEGGRSTKKPMRKNFHPTVKPTDLMLYLIRLVTPKGGTTLDPFMGSGSTGKAAIRGGFNFIGIEREAEYMEIAKARIQYETDEPINEQTGVRIKINKNSDKFW